MDAKGVDTLTQIQKYKAMLSSKRNKGEEKRIRKPQKKRLRKGDVETGLETILDVPGLAVAEKEIPSKSQTYTSNEENVDSTKLENTAAFSQESKQGSELLNTNVDELVEEKSSITSTEDQGSEEKETSSAMAEAKPAIDDNKQQEEKPKKEKSKALSIRRKRKKFKKKLTDDKVKAVVKEGEIEECLDEEKYSWKETEVEGFAVVQMLPEMKENEGQVSSEQMLEEKEEMAKESKSGEGEGKEKISRAQKFKRWASFTKQKKTNEPVDIENEMLDAESSKSTNLKQNSDSLENKAIEDDLNEDSSPGSTAEEMESSTKKETVNNTELTASLCHEKSKQKSEEKKVADVADDDQAVCENITEITSSEVEPKIPDLVIGTFSWKKDNEKVNEVESEPGALEQKTADSIKDGEQSIDVTETGNVNTEAEETGVPVKDEQPKKKKKSFLRKISSKSLKVKKEEKTEEEPRKEDISSPLKDKENQTGSEEVDPKTAEGSEDLEKPSKRKKSVLNLKLPKALKRKKLSEHKVTAGAEAEKEIEKNEPLTEGAEKEKESEKNEPWNEGAEKESEKNELLTEGAEKEKESEKNEPLTEGAEKEKESEKNEPWNEGAEKESEKNELLTEGAEKEKESEKNEPLTEGNKQAEEVDETYEKDENQYWKESCEDFYKIENVQPSVETDKAMDRDNSEYCEGGENADDVEVYSFCRAVMNDVIKELTSHIRKIEQFGPEEEDKNARALEANGDKEETKSVDELNKEEKEICKDLTHLADDSTVLENDNEMAKEEKSQIFSTPEKEEDVQEEPEKLKEVTVMHSQDITKEELNEEIKTNSELTEVNQSHEISKQSNETDEKIQEHSEDVPKQLEDVPNQPEVVLKQPEDVPKQLEDVPKQPEDVPKQSDDNLQAEQPEQVSEQTDNLSQPSEVLPQESEDILQPSEAKTNQSEGTSKPSDVSNEVSAPERSIEISMKTQALVDSYILIDDSMQFSQEFFNQVKLMDLDCSTKRKSRCSIM